MLDERLEKSSTLSFNYKKEYILALDTSYAQHHILLIHLTSVIAAAAGLVHG